MKVHKVIKKLGETPLEALERLRKALKISKEAKLTYAGRLDPMATGVLLILEGATQTDREKYMGLPKVYEAEVLFGFQTDTFDLLGIPTSCHPDRASASERVEGSLNLGIIKPLLKSLTGKILPPIPAYSSVPHKGQPMFMHARAGNLKKYDLPKREMEIKSIKLVKTKNISTSALLKYIQKNIPKVTGDFRQKEILHAWEKALRYVDVSKCQIVKVKISCGTGTYVRSIANYMGGTLYSLNRRSVGKYK